MKKYSRVMAACLPALIGPFWAPAALAQDDSGEIVVTARKRNETLIAVPVAVSAVSGADLEKRGVNSIDGIARLVPQLVLGEGASVSGGNIALRGISGADANPFADQAVSFNIDGVQVARSVVRRMSQMDIQQVEVLKGPQALFFGKNSPGGVISIRTGDPTRQFEGKASVGYEFNAHEWRGEGYIAGPISDDLGFRIAAYGSKMRGWVENVTPRGEIAAPDHRFAPRSTEYAVRGTLKYDPSDAFDARFKFSYAHSRNDGFTSNLQLISCANPTPQSGQIDDCRADDKVTVGAARPNFARRSPTFGDGDLYGRQKQILSGLELNYRPTDNLTITSQTGLFYVKEDARVNSTATYVPSRILAIETGYMVRELSQELRVASDFDGPVNFLIGAHAQSSRATTSTLALFNGSAFTTTPPYTPLPVFNYAITQVGTAYSAFAQTQWAVTDHLELSAGGRYSYEKKRLPKVRSGVVIDPATGVIQLPPPSVTPVNSRNKWNDFSPELTASYRPSRDLTIYGSYKHGFISGGFNSGSGNFTRPLDYDQQTVKGFEAGIKASLLDGALRTNLSLFSYAVQGLQVTVVTQGTLQELKNVGKVRTKGGEIDFSYRTPLEGLSLHGALAYDKARYVDYFASCYRGQTKALGCAFVPVPGTVGEGQPAPVGVNGALQDLAGTQLVRTPDWTGNIGFDYEAPIGGDLKIGLSGDMSFSGSYLTDAASNPRGRTPSYQLFNATLRVAQADERWAIDLIGRNLTEEYYWVRSVDSPFTGTVPGNDAGPSVFGDLQSPVSRGREIMLRVTTKF